ncbi:hypothetical protein D9X30_1694 (plasmid) [Cupriavidus sp. U2]|uniref:hypothetical protein n=1 Tax=Cupriavidus sp. U2 TaxID=2920269 RepID=UPI00129EE2F3|nr:hypothetical protein [Cupriavidus sp. U2]KAI3593384.1 hypothetical protein D9X30_1694 [Cupriavidus sp. U2]
MAWMKRSALWLAMALCSASASAQTSDKPAEILKIVASASADICGDVPTGGWDAGAHAGASIDASLKGFFKKLVDAKVVGSVGAGGGAYAGPLRTELAKVRADTQACKQDVSARLLDFIAKTRQDENQKTKRSETKRSATPPISSTSPRKAVVGASGDNSPVIAGITNSTITINNQTVPSQPAEPAAGRLPSETADEFALRYLQLVDRAELAKARELMHPSIRMLNSDAQWAQGYEQFATAYYPAKKRTIVTSQFIPAALYSLRRDAWGVYFKTVYRDGTTSSEANEVVGLVVDNGQWRVVEYRCLPCEDLAKRAAK